MRRLLFYLVLVLPLILLSSSFPATMADRGMIPINPSVSIYEPGQKAILAWNGEEEIMILSTDVHATNNTFVLEIMPLPSNPKKIEKASFESFVRLQEFIWMHAWETSFAKYWGEQSGGQIKSVQVTFHEKIGAHDITVVNASDTSEFLVWMEDFLESNNVSQEVSLDKFELVIADYMARDFRYFVLDLIEMSVKENSVEPILYRFETAFLYYPLKISSPISGDTKITLFILTNDKWYDIWYRPWGLDVLPLLPSEYRSPYYWKCYPLRFASYKFPYGLIRINGFNLVNREFISDSWAVEPFEPIHFNLTNGELSTIDPRIGELFENGAWLTVLEYDGALNLLTKDLVTTDGAGVAAHASEGLPPYIVLYGVLGAVCALIGATFASLIIYAKQSKEKMRRE